MSSGTSQTDAKGKKLSGDDSKAKSEGVNVPSAGQATAKPRVSHAA